MLGRERVEGVQGNFVYRRNQEPPEDVVFEALTS